MRKAFYMIFAAVMMCSCGIYTKYEPQTSVPDNLYGDSLSYGTDTASLGNVYWRELFTDTLLQNLIEEGLANNTDYKSAQLRIEEAEATLLAAKLAYLPSFAFAPQGSVSSFDIRRQRRLISCLLQQAGNLMCLDVYAMPSCRQRLFMPKA